MIKFGTGGFRGIIADDFTKTNVQLIAQGISDIAEARGFKDKPIVIGYDRRFMSDFFAGWMSEVFAANGIHVLLYTSSVPTPAVMSATKELGSEVGIMITASHNPYKFNGVKIFLKNGMDADVEFTSHLEKITNRIRVAETMPLVAARQLGLVSDFQNMDQYLENIKKFINPEIKHNSAKILFDNMNGMGAAGLKRLAKDFCISKFDLLNEEHDAFFKFIAPNPTEFALLKMKDAVIGGAYDYAIATDSDADRLGVLDDRGNTVNNNDILAALYYYLVKYRGLEGDIVKNCSTSIIIDRLAAKFGRKCHEVDVGFKNISAKMKETDALIGGESSGGLTVRGYIFGKDSIFSASLFMEMQIIMNKPVSEIIKEVRGFAHYDYQTAEDEIDVFGRGIFELAAASEAPFEQKPQKVAVFGNNIKYYFADDTWALIRMSGTEPVMRIVAEMPDRKRCEEAIATLKKFIGSLNDRSISEKYR